MEIIVENTNFRNDLCRNKLHLISKDLSCVKFSSATHLFLFPTLSTNAFYKRGFELGRHFLDAACKHNMCSLVDSHTPIEIFDGLVFGGFGNGGKLKLWSLPDELLLLNQDESYWLIRGIRDAIR